MIMADIWSEEENGFWDYSDEDIIDELSRHSGQGCHLDPTWKIYGVICEALSRILKKLVESEIPRE
jgi:hypothetical protein